MEAKEKIVERGLLSIFRFTGLYVVKSGRESGVNGGFQ